MVSAVAAKFKDWLTWFKMQERESAEIINKLNQEKLFSTFDVSISNSNCVDAILSHQEMVFVPKVKFWMKESGCVLII